MSVLCYVVQVMTRQVPWTQLRSEPELDAALARGERPSVQPSGAHCAAAVGAPAGYIELMNDCWATKPSDRPVYDYHDIAVLMIVASLI